MTDKDKPSNIKPIFAGLKVDTGEKSEPIPEIVECVTKLLAEATSGELRELCYVGMYEDRSFKRGIWGIPNDFSAMQNNLRILDTDYFDAVTYPIMSGSFSFDEDLE